MEEIKIEKNIPMPSKNKSLAISDIIKKMAVGDSIFIPNTTSLKVNSVYWCATLQGISVAVRKLEGGHRIWRIK